MRENKNTIITSGMNVLRVVGHRNGSDWTVITGRCNSCVKLKIVKNLSPVYLLIIINNVLLIAAAVNITKFLSTQTLHRTYYSDNLNEQVFCYI